MFGVAAGARKRRAGKAVPFRRTAGRTGDAVFQIRWIWKNIDRKGRRRFGAAMLLSAVTTLLLLVNPYLTSLLMDDVIVAQNPDPLLPLLAGMLAVQFTRLSLRYGMIMLLETTSQNMLYRLRCHLFGVLENQESQFFGRNRTGDLMTRLSADLDWCRHSVSYISYQVVDTVVMFTSTLAFFLTVNWQLTLALAAVTPFLLAITRLYSKKVHPLFMGVRNRMSRMNTAAQENIAGNRVVKAFAREEYERKRFEERNRDFRDANLEINRLWLAFFPWIELLANAMTVITLVLGGLFIMAGRLTFGELTIFTSMAWALANPMRNLGALINDIQRFFASASKVIEVYYARPLIADRPEAESHPHPMGRVEFRNVGFSFGSKKVLDRVSFTAEPGSTVAIMGPTGSGKTTAVNLLARFYDVNEGVVTLDGTDVRLWRLQELRSAIGMATQDVFLFSDTVEGNIAFGDASLSEEEVRDFARRAGADPFIRKMPEGYDTVVGERGVGLSGGQKQRVALARALAVKPAVLVLDDTTSALDMETEKYIQEQLAALPYRCTKIIIAQRISSVRDADQILIFDHGRIVQRGTHEELLRRPGYYLETYCLQNDLPYAPPAKAEESAVPGGASAGEGGGW